LWISGQTSKVKKLNREEMSGEERYSTDTGFSDREQEESLASPIDHIIKIDNMNLWLGSIDGRRHVLEHNIKQVIWLTTEVEMANTRIDLPSDVREKIIYISDEPTRLIEPIAKGCISIIERCVSNNENVFIHCQMGVSRSASVVIADLENKKDERPQCS
jgi:hypothetical protein